MSGSCQPYNLTVTSKYVSSISVCSCGCGEYAYEKHTFLNYCPACHHYGTLNYSKTCWGGQWTCSNCDADYCMQCGREKILNSDICLTSYNIPKQVVVDNMARSKTEQVQKSPMEIMFDKLKRYKNTNLLGLYFTDY